MKTVTAAKAFSEVQSQVEKIKNDEVASVGTVSLGDVIRQGDLYIVAIGALPTQKTVRSDRQLAPGVSQGSRHVLDGDCRVFDGDKTQTAALIKKANGAATPEELIGPVFQSSGEVTVTHPEHGDRILPGGECFAVVYQRQHAEEIRRQLD